MKYTFTLFLILLTVGFTYGQSTNENMAIPKNNRLPVAGSEKVDFIFSRTFLVESPEGVSLNQGRSGTYSIGVGYGIPLGKALEIKLEPRLTWQKLVFTDSDTTGKYFPSAVGGTNYVFEKLRMSYVEVPLGLKLKLARNIEDKYKFLVEAGFSFGFNIGSTAKSRFDTDSNSDGTIDGQTSIKMTNIPEVAELRYGPFGRIGTNWISIYGFYRMTNIFNEGQLFPSTTGLRAYPQFSNLEIGLSIRI